jgi:hypothetical protein
MTSPNIEAAAATGTPTATPAAPTTTPAPEAAAAPETTKMEEGGKIGTDKLQWVAIGIFSLTMVAVVYKAMFYRKAMMNLGNDDAKTTKKLKELEQNLRTVRGDKYEASA